VIDKDRSVEVTSLLTVTRERQLPGMFSHQLLKSLRCNNLLECSMNRFGAGFHPEDILKGVTGINGQ